MGKSTWREEFESLMWDDIIFPYWYLELVPSPIKRLWSPFFSSWILVCTLPLYLWSLERCILIKNGHFAKKTPLLHRISTRGKFTAEKQVVICTLDWLALCPLWAKSFFHLIYIFLISLIKRDNLVCSFNGKRPSYLLTLSID